MATPLLQTFSGSIHVPSRFSVKRPIIDASSTPSDGGPTKYILRDAPLILGNIASRSLLLENVKNLNGIGDICISLDGVYQADLILSLRLGRPQLRLSASVKSDLDKVPHPLASVLPSLDRSNSYVSTRWQQEARFVYLDKALIGPILWDWKSGSRWQLSEQDALLRYLGRTVMDDVSAGGTDEVDGFSRRFVEPGVGRSFLVDFLSVDGHPELVDFAASGVGLTNYSARGFVAVGRAVDGRVALKRAQHRRRNAERLEAAGCRASRVVAIIELPGMWVTMLDGSRSPAVIVVRAFRSILRVKQLDPIAGFYHSTQHGARVAALLMEKLAEEGSRIFPPHTAAATAYASSIASHLEYYAAAEDDIQRVLGLKRPWSMRWDNESALRLRQRLLAGYAPTLLALAKQRVTSAEFKKAPQLERMPTESYVMCFAEMLGAQLARMRQVRFLHDYHHPGVSRYRPDWLYTLVEHNVTLAGEFADLETGVFVDSPEEEIREELQLTKADVQILRSNFESFHETDVVMARRVVDSLAAAVATSGQLPGADVARVTARFDESYFDVLHS